MTIYPATKWRLIHSQPTDGAANMAVDEAILRAVAAGQVRPTLRFYAWQPGCLSLGRGQRATDVDMAALTAAGYDLVRRPTGGKAILHIDELTYSVVAPQSEPRVAGGVVESYRRLSAGLMQGLKYLGAPHLAAEKRRRRGTDPGKEQRRPLGPVCFEVPSDYEVTAQAQKLIGSAQMRAQDTVLQHGAVPLHGDIARICALLVARPDPARVRARATTVEQAVGRRITWQAAAQALAAGFAEMLNLRLEPGTLTNQERAWAKQLREEKYATEDWTRRR